MGIFARGIATNRKTGEVVTIVDYNGESKKRGKNDWVSFIDSDGNEHPMVKGLNVYWDFKTVFEDTGLDERERERQTAHNLSLFAAFAMQSLISNWQKKCNITCFDAKTIEIMSEESIRYAKALCQGYNEVDMKELIKNKQ